MRILKKFKKVGCAIIAIVLIMTACFPYGAGAKANAATDTTVVQMYANANGNFFTFKLDPVDWGEAENLTAPGATNYNYSFWQNIRLYQGESDTTGTTLFDASDKQIYFNFFDSGNTMGICILPDVYANVTKMYIPAGTAFPSYKATGGSTPFNGVDGDDVAADASGTSYVTTEDIWLTGGTDASSQTWEYWKTVEDTTVETLDIKDGRMVFNISGDEDNDALTDMIYIWQVQHDAYNFKDNIEIYVSGENNPKTLNDIFKASDGNLYWNLYEAGSMSLPLTDGAYDCKTIEKIVIKKGCEFPSVASTGGNSLTGGSGVAATLAIPKAYVVQEKMTFVSDGNTTSSKVSFVLQAEESFLEGVVANPSSGATVHLLDGAIYEFVTNYEQLLAKEYCTGEDRYMPTPVTITWEEVEGATGYAVQVSLKEDMSDAKQYKANGTSATVDDLYAGEHYFYQVLVQMNGKTYRSEIFDFHTSNLPRTVEIENVSNTRDIGGYYTIDGKYRVRQGMAYRGANADTISEAGKQKLLSALGVKTDLDLRGELNASPLGEGVNFVNVSAPQYMQIELGSYDEYKEALKEEIRTFANPDNYPIFYHCQIGRDRTGTLTLLIGALLGLSEEDLYRDYEMSFLSSAGGGSNPDIEKYVQTQFGATMAYLKNYGDGSLAENTEQYMLALGVNQGEIDAIRAILLEEVGAVEETTTVDRIQVRNGKLLVYLAVNDYSEVGANEKISNKIEEYNILDKVILYTGDTEYVSLRDAWAREDYYNALDESGCIAFTLKSGYDGNTLKKVVIKAGSQFPAAAYTQGELENRLSYVVKKQSVYVTNTAANDNYDWVLQDDSEPKKVSLNKIHSGHNGEIITFTLSESDYDGLLNETISAKHTAYNYLEKICIYTSETEYVSLGEALVNQRYYNMWEIKDTISLQLTPQIYQEAKKIVVPAGTVFPSAAYTNGIASFKSGYVVENELVFTKPANAQDGLGVGSAYAYDWELHDESAPTDISVTKIRSGHNEEIITFYLTDSDYAQGTIGESHMEYNYWENIRIYSDETNYKTLGQAYTNQKYYNMWNHEDTLSVQLTKEVFNSAVKIVIPEGTIFPSYAYTNTGVPQKGGYKTTEELVFMKPEGTGDLTWTVGGASQSLDEETTVETLDIKEGRMVFNISGDEDNDALTDWIFIWQVIHDNYNFKDYIEIYVEGESTPKTLNDIFKTSDGNLYWNLYEAGSMSLPLKDGAYDCTAIEKIVIKKGCEFPSVASTGGDSLTGGSGVSATLGSRKAYIVKKDMIFVPGNVVSSTNASFVLMDTSAITETAVTGVKTGHNNKNVTFTLSVTDYAGCATNRPSGKFANYNFLDRIQIHSGDTVQTLKEVYPAGDEIYYNLWGLENSLTIALGASYDTVTKIVIPKGTVFPSATYTGYGAWDQFDIPDNGVTEKGGFETTADITYVKPSGTGELNWSVEASGEPDNPAQEDMATDITNIHIRYSEISGYHLLFFLTEQDYGTDANASVNVDRLAGYNIFDHIVLGTTTGEEISLADAYDGEAEYNIWSETGSFSVKLKDGIAPINKIVIKAGGEFPARSYTEGRAQEQYAYVTKCDTIFTTIETPTDNTWSISWTKEKVLPIDVKDTEVTKVQFIGREGDVRLLLFLDKQDYAGIGSSISATYKYAQYNTLENIVLCKGSKQIPLSEIVTDEVYYNLWGNEGSISYGLKSEYTLNSFDKVLVKSGCEFPAYAFTSNESAEYMTAYATTKEKTIAVTQAKYKVTYYDGEDNVLYEDVLAFGSELKLRDIPKKKGYAGTWEGLKYDVMPAQDISYHLTYAKASGKNVEKEPDETEEPEENDQSPVTGDWSGVSIALLLLLSSAFVIGMSLKKRDIIGGRNERQ